MKALRLLCTAAAAALAACGGHGSAISPLPSANSPHGAKTASVNFVLSLPENTENAAAARRPSFVSANIKSVAITVASNGAAPGPATDVDCNSTACSAQLVVPIGSATFTVSTYDQVQEHGNLLSTGSATVNIVQNQVNNVTVTFNPVVKTVQLSIFSSFRAAPSSFTTGSGAVPEGQAYQATLQVNAYDPSGALILAPGQYLDGNLNPVTIAIANSDASGRVTLARTTVTGADTGSLGGYSNQIQITYNGGIAHGQYATFTASAPGYPASAMGQAVTLEITPTTQAQYAVTTPGFGQWAIADGADGRVWYAERTQSQGPGVVGALNISTGAVTEYPDTSACCYPVGIAQGSDGNMWAVEYPFNNSVVGAVAKITPSGAYTEYPLSLLPSLDYSQIIEGPDGNLYVPATTTTSPAQAYLAKIVPSTGARSYIAIGPSGSDLPVAATGYNDGRIYWVVRYQNGGSQYYAIGYYTPSTGTSTTIPTATALPGNFDAPFIAGSDGQLYFGGTQYVFNPSAATWTSYGCLSEAELVGADGRLYQLNSTATARFTPSTQYCDYLGYFTNGFDQAGFTSSPGQAIVGPDGNFWTYNGTYFGKIAY